MPFKKTNPEKSSKDNYLTLSATDESSIQAYYSALDFALSNDSVQNIGVIGAHASGKTSVLRSYNKHCKKHKVAKQLKLPIFKEDYVYITLGDYVRHMSDGDDEQQRLGHQSTTSELQYRIIEQLLCYNPPFRARRSTIPLLEKTFRRTGILHQILRGVFVALMVFAIMIGLNLFGAADALQSAVGLISNHPASILEVTSREESTATTADGQTTSTVTEKEEPTTQSNDEGLDGCFRIACIAIMSGVAAWQILRLYSAGITIKGMTIGGNSINMENKALPFDTQIDNLLYLLRCTKSHVMVFEDVDRVDDRYEILTNLRELCFELNVVERTSKRGLLSCLPWRRVKPYKFIYCLEQEGIPSTEERTKFFDFIVEMVPYGDYTSFGGLLDSVLRDTYHIDRTLLDRAGRTMNNARECEHMVNAFILRQKVLAESNRFTAASQVPPSFNNMVFALVAYKCMYPADYTRLSRGEGFLFESLQSYSKEDVLEGISGELDIDKQRPYATLAKLYGRSKTWDDGFLDMLESLPHAPTRKHVLDFVKFALEQGYINERYESYTSLWRGEMDEYDRKFCLYADARSIDESEKVAWWDRFIKDPNGVLNWLGYWSVADNECALNFSLLDQLLNANFTGTLGEEEERALMALLDVAAREDKLRFYGLYLVRCDAHQLSMLFYCINSPKASGRPALDLGRLEYVVLNSSIVDSYDLMVLSYLRAVSVAECPITIDDIVPRRDKLVTSIEGARNLLQASFEPWLETPGTSASDDNPDKLISRHIAREIAEGLSRLGVKLDNLEHSPENVPLAKAIIEHNCYAITPETIDAILDVLLTKEERLQFKDESIFGPLLYIIDSDQNYGAAIRNRMQLDLPEFISAATSSALALPRRLKDRPEVIYYVLDESKDMPIDTCVGFLALQAGRNLTYSRINNKLRPFLLSWCEPSLDNLESYLREHSDQLDDKAFDFILRIARLREPFAPSDDGLHGSASVERSHVNETQRDYLTPVIGQAVDRMRKAGEPEERISRVRDLIAWPTATPRSNQHRRNAAGS